ncbi:Uncharacterised protein [Vibrio cholerae]|nr:Uncharacterised protein [Vibrio cholerae]
MVPVDIGICSYNFSFSLNRVLLQLLVFVLDLFVAHDISKIHFILVRRNRLIVDFPTQKFA